MVALFDNIGYIAPIIGVVVIFVVIMVVRKLMAGTPDTHGIKGEDKPDKKSKDEDEKGESEDEEKEIVENLNVEAGIVHKLKTEEEREHDEEGLEEGRIGEVKNKIQVETDAISEEASAEQSQNKDAEKKAMEHEKKAIGALETDLQAISIQLKRYVGDEQKLNGDFGTAIEKLRKLNLEMSKLILSEDPGNYEPHNGNRIDKITLLKDKIKTSEQNSEQIINAIETEINRVRTDIQGVKSSYSPQAHKTLKNDLSTLNLSLGTEFRKITELRTANNKELEEIELMFEESVKSLEKVKKKIKVSGKKGFIEKAKEKLAEKNRNTLLLSGPIDAKEAEIKEKYSKEWKKLAEQKSQLLEKHDKLEDLESDEEVKSLTTVRREVQNKYIGDLREIMNERMNIGIDSRLAHQKFDEDTRSLDFV